MGEREREKGGKHEVKQTHKHHTSAHEVLNEWSLSTRATGRVDRVGEIG